PVRDPVRDARDEPRQRRGPDDDPDRPPVVLEQPLRLRRGGVDAPDARDVRMGGDLVPHVPPRPRGDAMTALAMSRRTRKRLIDRGLDVLAWLVLLLMLSPVFWLVASSMQTDGDLARGTYNLLHPTFTAFRDMWSTVEFSRYLINSAIICTAAAGLATVFASTAAYALARFRFRGAKPFGAALIGPQLIPGSMFLLPVFLGFVWLGRHTPVHLFDTRLGMILVYTAFFTPVAIFFLRSFFMAIPRELEDAALVDGCTPWGAFW